MILQTKDEVDGLLINFVKSIQLKDNCKLAQNSKMLKLLAFVLKMKVITFLHKELLSKLGL